MPEIRLVGGHLSGASINVPEPPPSRINVREPNVPLPPDEYDQPVKFDTYYLRKHTDGRLYYTTGDLPATAALDLVLEHTLPLGWVVECVQVRLIKRQLDLGPRGSQAAPADLHVQSGYHASYKEALDRARELAVEFDLQQSLSNDGGTR